MNKEQLINKYAKMCDKAKVKHAEARRNKFQNRKNGNEKEAHFDELDQERYAREFSLSEEMLNDLYKLNI